MRWPRGTAPAASGAGVPRWYWVVAMATAVTVEFAELYYTRIYARAVLCGIAVMLLAGVSFSLAPRLHAAARSRKGE